MNLFNRSIFLVLVGITFFGIFFAGCLDAPDYPHALQPVESINILVQQKDKSFSTILKVNPSDSATIKAQVVPKKYQNDIAFEWFYSFDGKDSLISQDQSYTFYPNKNDGSIPNKLIAIDGDGNYQIQEFKVVVNTPPELSNFTTPANEDVLYGSESSAFLFEWYSTDSDIISGDTLFHILEIDGKSYNVGTLLQVKQSGFKPGEHKFRVIVSDLYGDSDTLSYVKFNIIDTLEAK